MANAIIIRLMLAFLGWSVSFTQPRSEQFSLRCILYEPYFITFDTDAKRVVYESPAGSARKGAIIEQNDQLMRFELLRVGETPLQFVWHKQDQTLLLESHPAWRPDEAHKCSPSVLRPVLPNYDRIAPSSP
jgi:hypothetical protein